MVAANRTVTLLYRKRTEKTHSIERVFHHLAKEFNGTLPFREVELPFDNKGLINKIRNILWMFRIKGPIHVTGDVYYSVLFKRNYIATIHDIGILGEVGRLKKLIIKFIWFDQIAAHARKLVFISNHSRNDFLTRVKADVSSTTVIHNPLLPGFHFQGKEFNPGKPVILQIGTKANKNIIRLAGALRGISCQLVIIGQLNPEQKNALKVNSIEFTNKHNLGDDEIYAEYLASDIVVLASLHEGFGLPVIEAQAIGRPVVTSNISSMPEIAGKGACLVDPYDIESIRKGILCVINDAAYRESLIAFGKENVQRFETAHIAQQYIQLYMELWYGKS